MILAVGPTAMSTSAVRIGARVPRLNDVALITASAVGVGVCYWGAGDSLPAALGAAIAVASATAVHARQAIGRAPSLVQISIAAAVLYALDAPGRIVTAAVVGAVSGEEMAGHSANRMDVMRAGLWTALAAATVLVLANVFAGSLSGRTELREVLGASIGGLLAGPLVLAIGPFAERLFNHTTRLTMTEWLSYEHPLLHELAVAAPGTFQHSVNVGVLADVAARAIGADALLARIGGLYHDVGKIPAPQYFAENQRDLNPHDQMARRRKALVFCGRMSPTAWT
jgi:putative nucleotidyltransferase with HDIG domain